MNTKKIAFMGIATALIFVATQIRIPVPVTQGYVNLGDGVILICSFLAGPWAIIPAAVGSALSDLIGGYTAYIIPTLIIKGLLAWISYVILNIGKPQRPTFVRRLLAFIPAEIFMAGGYLLFEALPFMYGLKAALLSFPFNLVQAAVAVVIAMSVTSAKTVRYRLIK